MGNSKEHFLRHPAGIWDGHWHAVAGTYDGAAVRLYADGIEVGSGTPATATVDYSLAQTDLTI
ncbi:MAG: LamG domain-containing protein, partial [Actinobacteria bacterium]|nr:LamG domain-containing protein [Actinomycetota bacterium]